MQEPSFADLALVGPARRTLGSRALHLAGAPHGHGDGDGKGGDTASPRDEAAGHEDVVRIGVEPEPPPEEGGRQIDRQTEQQEPLRGWPCRRAKPSSIK